ncbi:MAG: ribbon-helix-helix domain-containing protein [Alphaproteobacteria bacterium]
MHTESVARAVSRLSDLEAKDSNLVSRNVTVDGHRTSVRLEPEMWEAVKEICRRERASLHEICTMVAQYRRPNSSLTAAVRVFIMAYFRTAATDEGHDRAGHGRGPSLTLAANTVMRTDFGAGRVMAVPQDKSS